MGLYTGFPGGSVVKNSPANAGDAGDMDSVPGSGRSPGAGNGHYSSILAWEIPRTETGGLQSMGLQTLRPDLAAEHDLFPMHCPLQVTFQGLPLNSLGIAYLPVGLLP